MKFGGRDITGITSRKMFSL